MTKRNKKSNKLTIGTPWLPNLLCKHWFTLSVWNFCCWVANVPPGKMSLASRSKEKQDKASYVKRLWQILPFNHYVLKLIYFEACLMGNKGPTCILSLSRLFPKGHHFKLVCLYVLACFFHMNVMFLIIKYRLFLHKINFCLPIKGRIHSQVEPGCFYMYKSPLRTYSCNLRTEFYLQHIH